MKCECGHDAGLHCALPGHPYGAIECYGSDDCDCGEFRPKAPVAQRISERDRSKVRAAGSNPAGGTSTP